MLEHQVDMPDLLTYEEAAQQLGIALVSVKQAISRGVLHPIKLPHSRTKFLRKAEVESYRRGKPARPPQAVQRTTLKTAAQRHSLTADSVPFLMAEDDLQQMLHLALVITGADWQTNAALIQETLLGVFDRYFAQRRDVSPTADMSSAPRTATTLRRSGQSLKTGQSGPDEIGDRQQPHMPVEAALANLVRAYREEQAGQQKLTANDEQLLSQVEALVRAV